VFHIEPTELFPQVSLTLLKRTLFEVCGLYNPPKEIEKTRENSFCSFVSLPFVWHFSDFLFSYLPIVFSRKTFKWKSFIECDIPTPTPIPFYHCHFPISTVFEMLFLFVAFCMQNLFSVVAHCSTSIVNFPLCSGRISRLLFLFLLVSAAFVSLPFNCIWPGNLHAPPGPGP